MSSLEGKERRNWWMAKAWMACKPVCRAVMILCCILVGWNGWIVAREVRSIELFKRDGPSQDVGFLSPRNVVEYEEIHEESRFDIEVDETCVGMILTRYCTPWGPVRVKLSCTTSFEKMRKRMAGYCLCGNGRTTAHRWCGQRIPINTCADACKFEANRSRQQHMYLPLPLKCKASDVRNDCMQGISKRTIEDKGKQRDRTLALWTRLYDAYTNSGAPLVSLRPPGPRNGLGLRQDFVKQGLHLTRTQIHEGRQQWKKFLAKAPKFTEIQWQQRGKGIVIVGGVHGQYLLATLVQVMVLRKLGCRLPVEIWLPEAESPTLHHEAVLRRLGVQMRLLLNETELPQSGYAVKITAVALSRFREVLLLDSDNIPAYDPSYLFQSKPYQETGAVVWPDLWDNSAAPDLFHLLEMNESQIPHGTHESGQLLLDKRKVWPAIMLALFMNLEGELYFPLLTEHLGQGDKETIPYSLAALGLDYHAISYPVQPLGITAYSCDDPQRPQLCLPQDFFMNAMLQYDMHGRALFVHNNHIPKASLFLPASFEKYVRRWQRVRFKDTPFLEAIRWTGVDIERVVYETQRKVACDQCIIALFEEPLPGFPPRKKKGLDPRFFYYGEQLPLMGGFGSHLPLVARNISFTEVFGAFS